MKNYWRVKAVALETELRLSELNKAAAEIVARKQVVFDAEGLDSTLAYRFDDAKEEAVADE